VRARDWKFDEKRLPVEFRAGGFMKSWALVCRAPSLTTLGADTMPAIIPLLASLYLLLVYSILTLARRVQKPVEGSPSDRVSC